MDDIYFVLTVPATWDDTAKMFMREAAVQVHTPHIEHGHLAFGLKFRLLIDKTRRESGYMLRYTP